MLEPIGRQSSMAIRGYDRAVPEIGLNGASVVTVVEIDRIVGQSFEGVTPALKAARTAFTCPRVSGIAAHSQSLRRIRGV
jgi:hypothetical protein